MHWVCGSCHPLTVSCGGWGRVKWGRIIKSLARVHIRDMLLDVSCTCPPTSSYVVRYLFKLPTNVMLRCKMSLAHQRHATLYFFFHQSCFSSIHQPLVPSFHVCIYPILSTYPYLPIYLSLYQIINLNLSTYLPINLFIYLPTYLSIHSSV